MFEKLYNIRVCLKFYMKLWVTLYIIVPYFVSFGGGRACARSERSKSKQILSELIYYNNYSKFYVKVLIQVNDNLFNILNKKIE